LFVGGVALILGAADRNIHQLFVAIELVDIHEEQPRLRLGVGVTPHLHVIADAGRNRVGHQIGAPDLAHPPRQCLVQRLFHQIDILTRFVDLSSTQSGAGQIAVGAHIRTHRGRGTGCEERQSRFVTGDGPVQIAVRPLERT